MKPTPKQPNGAKKLPGPQLMYLRKGYDVDALFPFGWGGGKTPYVCVAMPSKRAALAKKKWETMGREAKIDAFVKAMMSYRGRKPGNLTYGDYAEIFLALQGEPTP